MRRSFVLFAIAATMALVTAPAASAGCGGVQSVRGHHRHGQPYYSPLAVGDSTMLLSLPYLAGRGYSANARGCRQWAEGMALLRYRKARHTLPHLVVMALGADWIVTPGDIRAALRLLGRDRVLALVTPRESGGGSGSDAANERSAARHHPHRIVLLDWVRHSYGHGSWFQPDGLHLTWPGARELARFIGRSRPWAKPGHFPRHLTSIR